ncbi:5'-nucleotidase (lipoprotein e(P4) family) [Mycoplasmopsis mustelae]|uniref:5'-nucleotidase (Lipoprotein e(P4) family) n=1 Tax=Mycoplasmopsis mustelae TaxID=171289 RepID=A0A4V3FNW9_9BACT|nr:HAD family acid phosphatase [Mycoplasmopsis mustelae]TDV24080.1 5'-nucleotidase (lipoprotein e(P4) family) [Mycoplasmopsis mustelae]
MKFKKIILTSAAFVATVPTVAIAAACGPTEKPQGNKFNILSDQGVFSNLWNSVSAERDAMALSQYRSAMKQFDALVDSQKNVFELDKAKIDPKTSKLTVSNTSENKSIPVVFMDIDETILDNFGYQHWLVANNASFSPETWNEFVQDKVSKKIPGAFEFIDHVYKKGGIVMFNSNREQKNQLIPTRENLIKEGLNKAYLPDWVFWMQGVDLNTDKPWANIKEDENGKRIKSHKEERMNLVNSKKWNLSVNGQDFGDAVSLKTVMRIGDNFDDFNDIRSANQTNEQRKDIVNKELGKLFGNFDSNVKGIKYTKDAQGNAIKSEESWAEGYVQIGGNASYGGWVSGLAAGFNGFTNDKKLKTVEDLTNALKWTPSQQKNS